MSHYGVLLPLRLETRFFRPGEDPKEPGQEGDLEAGWRLRVRVFPDRASITRGSTDPDAAELASLQSLWDTIARDPGCPAPLPADADARRQALSGLPSWSDAFGRLAALGGPARASWLVDNVPVVAHPPRVEWTGDISPWRDSRVVGLPTRLDVWVIWTDADDDPNGPVPAPEVIGTLEPKPEQITLDLLPDRSETEAASAGLLAHPLAGRWWAGWEGAIEAGLAAEISLSRHPDEIAVLGVSGLGADETTAAELLGAHAAAGDLGVLRPGTATSTVFGASTVDTESFSDYAGGATLATHPVVELLSGVGSMPGLIVDRALATHQAVAGRLVTMCYPALWGYGLQGVLDVVRDRSENIALWEWAANWLRPEGVHPPVRIGDQAYGVVALAVPGREIIDGLEPRQAFTPIDGVLARTVRRWAAAAERTSAIDRERAMHRSLHQGPVPSRLRGQRLVPSVFEASTHLGGVWAGLADEWRVQPASAHVLERGDPDDQDATLRRGRLYRALGRSFPLRLPLLLPDQAIHDDAVFDEFVTNATWGIVRGDQVPIYAPLGQELPPGSLLAGLYRRSAYVAAQLSWDPANGAEPGEIDPWLLDGFLEPLFTAKEQGQRDRPRAVAQAEQFDRPGLSAIVPREDVAEVFDPVPFRELLDYARTDDGRHIVERGVRALVDASSARWDPWLTGIGAAHAEAARARGAKPTLGAYGWVDAPYRGTAGPGPGGFHVAPSPGIAKTLAVLRARALEDANWNMDWTTADVSVATRWIADLSAGWHPAESLGRMIERQISESDEVTPAIARGLIDQLRARFPLRPGQGGHGCTNGLRAEAAFVSDNPGAPLDVPAVAHAVAYATRVLEAAGDLQLADGVHGFLNGQPERASAAMRSLGGSEDLMVPGFLDPAQPVRAVRTTVLFAAPPAAPDVSSGPAATAAPGLSALLAATHPGDPRWLIAGGGQTIAGVDVFGSHLDLVTVDLATADVAVSYRALELGLSGGRERPTGLESLREWATALTGRAAAASQLGERTDAAADVAADSAAAAALASRLDLLRSRADALRAELVTAAVEAEEREHARVLAELAANGLAESPLLAAHRWFEPKRRFVRQPGGPPVNAAPAAGPHEAPDEAAIPPEPKIGPPLVDAAVLPKLARLAVAAAQWGITPPDVADLLVDERRDVAARAFGELVAFLLTTAEELTSRIAAVDALVPDATSASLASAIAALVGRAALPIGAPLAAPSRLEGADSPLLSEWSTAITTVKPHLDAPLTPPHGLRRFATGPEDPWRRADLARIDARTSPDQEGFEIPPEPHLTVVVAPAGPIAGETYDWVVLDDFTERVPTSRPEAGASFDVATPSSRPPQAILVVPPSDLDADGPDEAEVRALVAYARVLAHGRMANGADLGAEGLGMLAAFAALPRHEVSGIELPGDPPVPYDAPWVLVPEADDADDVIAAVTGDGLWMLGQQWRMGEHAGEDAATPVHVRFELDDTKLEHTSSAPDRSIGTTPIEGCLEAGDPGAPETDDWVSPSLSYASKVVVDGAPRLGVPVHAGGDSGWWEFIADSTAVPAAATSRSVRAIPGALTWPGAPTGRYWQIEDRPTDIAGSGPDRTKPATLHLIDVLSRVGQDLYVVGFEAPPGTIIRPRDVSMTDSMEGKWRLPPAVGWRLTTIEGLDADADWAATLMLTGARAALAGPILDDVAFAVDEDDNLVWAAEFRIAGKVPTPPSLPFRVPRPFDGEGDAPWRWQLRRHVPSHRFPYQHGFAITAADGAGEDLFVRAQLVTADGTVSDPPTSVLLGELTRLEPLAIPSSGVRLVRQPILARATDGSPVLWQRRQVRPLDASVDVDLRWDPLTRLSPE